MIDATIEETATDPSERVWAAPNEHGVFEDSACEQIYAPVLSGVDCIIHVIEQADGWRAVFSAQLPDSGHGSLPSPSDPTYPARAQAVNGTCEALIAWLSDQKEKGSKRHQKAAGKLQDWALLIAKTQRAILDGDFGTAIQPAQTIPAHPEATDPSSPAPPTPNPVLHASAIPEGELRLIPITELYESPDNPRQHYPEAAMSELVESMKQSGFRPWLPLLVRPCGQSSAIWRKLGDVGGYEIGAGHRRRRAAELAGIAEIPCIVAAMTDEQFLDVLNFDNSGREDVHPLHEASGWRQWMEKTGKGVLDIAARIGQSKEYVYQRLKYAALTIDAQKAFLDGKISAGHAIEIARRDAKEQAKWLKFCLNADWRGQAPSVRALREALHRDAYIDLRDNCPFDRTDKTLLAGAGDCDACPKRAANIPGFEYDPEEPNADLCTDRVCHAQKIDNHLYRIRADIYAAQGHYPLQVSNQWNTKKKGVYPRNDWEKAKDGAKGARTALIVEGEDIGQVIKARLTQSAPAPEPESGLSTPAKSAPSSKADQSRQVAEQQAKQKQKEETELGIRRQILQAVRAKVGGLSRADLEALLLFVLNPGEECDVLCSLHSVEFKPGMAAMVLCKALPKLKESELFQLVVELPVAGELDEWGARQQPKKLLDLAKRYKVDAAKIRKDAEKAAKGLAASADAVKASVRAGAVGSEAAPEKPKPAVPGKTLTAEVRKRIAKKQKERWAKFRKQQNAKLAKKKAKPSKKAGQ